MPKYAKFLKDLLSNKKRLEEISIVSLSEECSAVIQNKLPQKMMDGGSFTIPCLFGGSSVSHVLADLGASVNLMPYSIFSKLDLGEPIPTRMSIQLADRSVKYPRGIVENVLVKVDQFVFPVDFIVLLMEVDDRVPLILGRPFLRTAKALIDVFDGNITLRVGDETVTFDFAKSVTNSSGQGDLVSFLDASESRMDGHPDRICEEKVGEYSVIRQELKGTGDVRMESDRKEKHVRFKEEVEVVGDEDKFNDGLWNAIEKDKWDELCLDIVIENKCGDGILVCNLRYKSPTSEYKSSLFDKDFWKKKSFGMSDLDRGLSVRFGRELDLKDPP
ncbi:putative aspartic peptidase domain superfamily [Helianthus annuus]|nr:putative aspartic peptidase domain superfamily [Helianthus annuus]